MDWDKLIIQQIENRIQQGRASDYLICTQDFFEILKNSEHFKHIEGCVPHFIGMKVMVFEHLGKPNIMSQDEFDIFCQELFGRI